MGKIALGNVPEHQQVIYENLKKVTKPHAPKELYLSFVDTASYFKAQEKTDERRKNRRLERSGREIFINNLNHFVAEKGVLQKINLPLNTIAAEILNVSGNASDKDNSDFTALIETFGGAGAFVAQEGAQIATQFAQPAVQIVTSEAGIFAGNATKALVTFFGAEDLSLFSAPIGNGLGNLLKSLPFFEETIVSQPTTVNRIASTFTGNGSKIFGAAMAGVAVLFSIFMLHREGKKAEEQELELRRKRNEIMSGFNDLADDIGRDILIGVQTFMTQNVNTIIATFDEKIKAVENQTASEQVKSEKLAELLNRTENLIGEIQITH